MSGEPASTTTPFSATIPDLLASHHAHMREGSGLPDEVIRERGYRSALGKHAILRVGFKESQWAGPGILIPTFGPDGQPGSYVYRPDKPKERDDESLKYVNPLGSSLELDVPPRCRSALGDPTAPLAITEGVKKGDALATHGFCAVALSGVWGFKGKNADGGITLLAQWDHIALNGGRHVAIIFDSDVMAKPPVRQALERLAEHIRRKGGAPRYVYLPALGDGAKMGVDDYLVRHGQAALQRLVDEADSAPLQPLPAEVSWEVPPHRLVRPLDLHDGVAYAVIPLDYKETVREERGKNGGVVALNPPRSTWKRATHVVVFDGERRRLVGPLAAALGRPADADEDVLRELGVLLAVEAEASEAGCWSREGIKAFLAGKTPTLGEVLQRLIAVLDHFMDYLPVAIPDRRPSPAPVCLMIALWILGTYFVPAAQVVGYLLPTGPAGSGKTKQLTVISLLAYLGEVINQAGTTAALKYLAQSGATLCVDDVENIQDKSFDPDKRSIILAGNRRGVTVPILEQGPDKKWVPRRFPVFCPKAFSSIRGFDAVLGSRTIAIPLVRTASAKANREAGDLEQWPCDRRQLVDDLWAVALLHLREVEALYRDTRPATLAGRELEPWRLILTMARLVDRHAGTRHYDEMLALALAKRGEAHDRGEMSDELWLLKALVRLVLEQGKGRLAASEIAGEIARLAVELGVQEADAAENPVGNVKVGKLIRALQVTTPGSKHHGTKRLHHLDEGAIRQRARAYGVLPAEAADGTGGTGGDGWDSRRGGAAMTDDIVLTGNYEEEWPDGEPPF